MKVRWGILGVAKIATEKVIPAMQRGQWSDVTAIASRDLAKARRAATALGIPKAYGSYDELLNDPDIDAIYNPLPNHLHVPWTTKAAERGKHVLCEKPLALSADEARTLIDVRDRTGVKMQEAFMVRAHPQWLKARALVREGRIGDLRSMLGVFSYFNRDPNNIRSIPEWGGGGLMDIGCYLINTSRFIFEREPARVIGVLDRDPDLGIDRMASILLDFGAGHSAGTCSTQMVFFQRMQIFGTRGRIEIEIPFNAPGSAVPDAGRQRTDLFGTGIDRLELDTCNQIQSRATSSPRPFSTTRPFRHRSRMP
jgi:predicted dehydrogenase